MQMSWTSQEPERGLAGPWFLNADLLAEIDEEYRRLNQTFRNYVKRTAAKKNHPLGFLLNMKDAKGRSLFDAGHVIPVKVLKQKGTRLERLVVEDRGLNRGKQAKPVERIVNVAGIPVDCASLHKWVGQVPQRGQRLTAFLRDCRPEKTDKGRFHSDGWFTSDQTTHELEFVLSLPGTTFVKRHDLVRFPSLR